MKKPDAILKKIENYTQVTPNIITALLTGSRIDPKIKKDSLQDYDVILIVDDIAELEPAEKVIHFFGEPLIVQFPDEIDNQSNLLSEKTTYLMQFKNGIRVDMTLMTEKYFLELDSIEPFEILENKNKEELNFPFASETYFFPKKPTEVEFHNCCNEFWWVSLYVAKGIARRQHLYALKHLEIIRAQLIKLLTWYCADQTQYKTNFGNSDKYLERYLPEEIKIKFFSSYTPSDLSAIKTSLFNCQLLFKEVSHTVAVQNHFKLKEAEEDIIRHSKNIIISGA